MPVLHTASKLLLAYFYIGYIKYTDFCFETRAESQLIDRWCVFMAQELTNPLQSTSMTGRLLSLRLLDVAQ